MLAIIVILTAGLFVMGGLALFAGLWDAGGWLSGRRKADEAGVPGTWAEIQAAEEHKSNADGSQDFD